MSIKDYQKCFLWRIYVFWENCSLGIKCLLNQSLNSSCIIHATLCSCFTQHRTEHFEILVDFYRLPKNRKFLLMTYKRSTQCHICYSVILYFLASFLSIPLLAQIFLYRVFNIIVKPSKDYRFVSIIYTTNHNLDHKGTRLLYLTSSNKSIIKFKKNL